MEDTSGSKHAKVGEAISVLRFPLVQQERWSSDKKERVLVVDGETVEDAGVTRREVQEFPILINITLSVAAAFVGGFLARLLKLPTMVGYLLMGVVIGPFTPSLA